MTSTLQEALRLSQQFNWSVVPLRPKEKIALVRWTEFQERRATAVEIFQLWAQFPDANLGVILGEISGIAQIDCDDDSAVEFITPYLLGIQVPTVKTRRGKHYYFRVDPDLQTASGYLQDKVEYRSRGHLAVVPPSTRSDGEPYTWEVTVEDCGGVPAMPAKLKADLLEAQKKAGGEGYLPPENCPPYQFGRRDDDLFHTAYSLLRGGMDVVMATDALRRIASTMNQKDMPNLDVKIASAMKRAMGKGDRNISQEVKEWLESEARGSFNTQELYTALGMHALEEQKAARTALYRLSEEGKLVKRNLFRYGWYEALSQDAVQPMDWRNADSRPLDLRLPLLLNTAFESYSKNIIIVASPPDGGKGVINGTPILTPTGWAPIESLAVGDRVIAGDGSVTAVSGVFPRGPQQCIRWTFNDGSDIVTDIHHLWSIKDYQRRKNHRIKTRGEWKTVESYRLLGKLGWGAVPYGSSFTIPTTGAVQLPGGPLPLDPYILGILLGDGCFSKSSVCLITADPEIRERVAAQYQLTRGSKYHFRVLRITGVIRALGLDHKRSWEKHIPPQYLWGSVTTRLETLRGLMDTDGTVGKAGSVSFTTTSQQLANDVEFLVRSLGGRVVRGKPRHTHYRHKGVYKTGRESYCLFIAMDKTCPFWLERKASRWHPRTESIDRRIVDLSDAGIHETTCISVAHPSQLYVTKDFIVTHNTVFLQNVIKLNMDRWQVIYQNSESSAEELHRRLLAHRDVEDWKMTVYERNANYDQLIGPDALNVIDFLEIGSEFWKTNLILTAIHAKLQKGVAVIGLQKSYFQDLGRGAEFSLEKPRLYVTMDRGLARIIKCKNRPVMAEPAFGKVMEYEIRGGWQLVELASEWHHEIESDIKSRSERQKTKRLF